MNKDDKKEDLLRKTIGKLINESNATFSSEDVLREFRGEIGDKQHERKLLKILEIISKNQRNRQEHLAEAAKVLECTKDPKKVLALFLHNYNQKSKLSVDDLYNMLNMGRKKDISTSTPFVSKQTNKGETAATNDTSAVTNKLDGVTLRNPSKYKDIDPLIRDNVSEIKERVRNAASGSSINRPVPSNSNVTSATAPKTTKRICVTSNGTDQQNDIGMDNVWNFPKIDGNHNYKHQEIAAIPIESQETLLLNDLILVLSGVRGNYIEPTDPDKKVTRTSDAIHYTKFSISKDIQISLRDIAQEILPMAAHFSCVQKFIAKTEDHYANPGQVLQALGAELRILMHDYYLLLAQLEAKLADENLTLHKMIFYVNPTIRAMEVIAGTLADVSNQSLRGGRALTLLCEKINDLTGDEDTAKFITDLTVKAAVPYMETLQLWIQKGAIVDPAAEFLVEDNEGEHREEIVDHSGGDYWELPEHYSADYWEKRYTIRRERVPCFLHKVADIILNTGKYLNVIRHCGKKVVPTQNMKLEFIPNSQQHIKVIEDAYYFASKTLLDVLLNENDLMGHLMSVKRYLLLYQGDFIMQFMDACDEELSKNVDQVLPMVLDNLLGLTLRLSAARNDPYKDDLHCELLTYDLVTQMTKIMHQEAEYWQERTELKGLECFAFTYEVKWPVSLVLNHIAISKYQMLFRQLFYCKHVERQLCKIWKANSKVKKYSPKEAELYRPAFTLRQRMMNAIQNLEYYMLIEIIEPNWHTFIEKMRKVENVDEVLVLHQDFLDSCLKNCMLTETIVLNRSIFKMCKICLKFCDFIQTETSFAPTDTFSERVNTFDLEFTGVLIAFLRQINDVTEDNTSERYITLVHRMNFNNFYTEQMEKLCAKDAMVALK